MRQGLLSVKQKLYYITGTINKVMPNRLTLDIFLEEYQEHELDSQSLGLMRRARKACDAAYAPYSEFQVGAAVQLVDGEVIVGNNQENASYPNGLCAERVALFAAASNYPGIPILKIALSACKNSQKQLEVTPCGGCRQAMMEYQSLQTTPIEIFMEGPPGKVYRATSVDMLLPFKFSGESLK